MTRIIGPPRSRRRRWTFLWALVVLLGVGMVFISGAQAVHDTGVFQLDGDAATSTDPMTPAATDDWDKVCHQVVGSDCGTSSDTTGATSVAWANDGPLNATIFTGGGSKDPQNIDQWAWKDGAGGLPDKDNLLHSFAVRYSLPPDTTGPTLCPAGTNATCELLFFGSDRYDNSGDAQQGFWFFQNRITLGSNAVGGGSGFNGLHKNGDILVISDFSNGGTTSTITVFAWDTACTATNKPDASCADANLRRLETSDAAKCSNTLGGGDSFCGIVNPGTITMPWSFTDKSGTASNGALNGEFYEGGINLSLLPGGIASECFASVASETRSSTSTTATLKDFVLGDFGDCTSHTKTTPKQNDGTDIPAGGLSIGTGSVLVKDEAKVTVSGTPTWSGTVSFHLCFYSDPASTTTCDTGGAAIGSAKAVSNPSPATVTSDAATVTSVGRYCWRADFSGDSSKGVPGSSDSASTECFVVNPVTPTLTTNATASVTIGSPISDTATLGGTANKPGTGGDAPINPTTPGGKAGGSITFKAYGPSDPNCTGTPAFTSSAVTVSGDGNYGSGNFTPTSAGTYKWVASYTGDSPNTKDKATACNDANETTVVNPKQPTISTNATAGPVPVGTALDDTATLSGTANKPDGTAAGGTITFSLYGPSDLADCTTAIATRVVNVSGDGSYKASNGTGSGSLSPTSAGNYWWIASYSGDSPNTKSVSGACGDANEGSILVQLQPTISTAQTFTVKDSATITVAAGAGNLAGSVRFRLYNNATCDASGGGLLYDSNVNNPSGIAVAGSGSFPQSVTVSSETTTITTSKPTLSWLVEYTSTNGGHKNVTSSCNTEHASLSITNG